MESTNETAEAMFRAIADLHAAYGQGVTITGMDRDEVGDCRHVTLSANRDQIHLGVSVYDDGEVYASPLHWKPSSPLPDAEPGSSARVAYAIDMVRVFLHQFGHGAR